MAEVRARQTAVESAERRTGALRDEAKVQAERLVCQAGDVRVLALAASQRARDICSA